jgi:hypothetical protein
MQEALHRTLVCADLERSGALDDLAKADARKYLHAVFAEALAEVGLTPDRYSKEDRGDGVLITIDHPVSESLLAGRWILDVNERIRELNRTRRDPLRLRIGMHSGQVRRDEHGVSGAAVDFVSRMTNADVTREVLAAVGGASLAFFVSESFHKSVIRTGGRYIESALYRRVRAQGKSIDEDVWAYVPLFGLLSADAASSDGAHEESRAQDSQTAQARDTKRADTKQAEASAAGQGQGAPSQGPTVNNRFDEIHKIDYANFGVAQTYGNEGGSRG